MNKSYKECVVTYSTIDNQVRTAKVPIYPSPILPEPETLIYNISTFIETKQWPEEPVSEITNRILWGLNKGKRCYGKKLQFPTETQDFFYRWVLQHTIISKIAKDCSKDKAFATLILEESAIRAKQKDEAEVAANGREKEASYNAHGYQDALSKVKQCLRYHQTHPDSWYDDVSDFSRLIEEFELYTLLDIQLCN